jgi:hypothetical protein
MATYKRIDGDYAITTLNSSDNVTITTHTVEIVGNLDVSGNLTYINVEELNVKDPFIVLNSSNTGSYPSNSGVLTHLSVSDFAGIRYDNTASEWQLSSSTDATGLTGTWVPIATGSASAAGANTQVQFNDGSGTFGANANFTFDKAVSKVTVQGHMVLGNIGATPTATANAAALYNKAEGSGGTGVYVKSSAVDDELVSKSAAIVFAIIF